MLRNIFTNAISALILVSLLAAQERFVFAMTCPEHKIVIPFINGVFVTKTGAKNDVATLESAICANPSDTAMCQNGDFELLYNESGLNNLPADQGTLQSALSLVTGAFQDIIETLWQIAHQNARTSPNWFDYLLYIFMHPASTDVISLMASQEAYAVAHPPTQADVSSMESAMDGWYAAGDDILLTAHSQGNLFANQVYGDFFTKHGATYIASYGIAPPSLQYATYYSLNSDDQVIKLASVADAVLNPGNPPPTPNASQLCTDYVAPTSLTNLGTDAACFADHGLNFYLEKQLGIQITSDIGMQYTHLLNSGYPLFQFTHGDTPIEVFQAFINGNGPPFYSSAMDACQAEAAFYTGNLGPNVYETTTVTGIGNFTGTPMTPFHGGYFTCYMHMVFTCRSGTCESPVDKLFQGNQWGFSCPSGDTIYRNMCIPRSCLPPGY